MSYIKISESQGTISGFTITQIGSLNLVVDSSIDTFGGEKVYEFPFNENRPKKFSLDDFQWKRVRITVEIMKD